jgi:hypothetical protein
MATAATDNAAMARVRALVNGEYKALFDELEKVFGYRVACKVTLRAVLGKEYDAPH